jgi:hypothetical protein
MAPAPGEALSGKRGFVARRAPRLSRRRRVFTLGGVMFGRERVSAREVAVIALATGAVAVGAFAIGALAIGTLAVRRLVVRGARLGTLEIDRVRVRRLEAAQVDVGETLRLPAAGARREIPA